MLLISAMVWLPVWRDEADVAHPCGGSPTCCSAPVLRPGVPPATLAGAGGRGRRTGGVRLGVAAGPAVLAASVATRRRWREIAVVGVVNFAAGQTFSSLTDADTDRGG